MIEISADEFYGNQILSQHVYIDENKISLVSTPKFYQRIMKHKDEYVDLWVFSIVIDGSYQSFQYLKKDICKSYYDVVLQAFISKSCR